MSTRLYHRELLVQLVWVRQYTCGKLEGAGHGVSTEARGGGAWCEYRS